MSSTDTSRPNAKSPYATTYEADDDIPLSVSVVLAVAEAKGCDPTDLGRGDVPSLADSVDPDCLDSLGDAAAAWAFEVDIWNCHVRATSNGTITVTPV